MLMHRISRGAHIVETNRVSMALQAMQAHCMPSLIAMDMIEVIREHLDVPEDLYLSEQRLATHRAGESPATPLAEVMKRYGLEG